MPVLESGVAWWASLGNRMKGYNSHMSYDLEIWSKEPTPDPGMLPGFEELFTAGGDREEGWIINVDGPLRVLPEDMPPECRELISDKQYLTYLHLEPVHAPAEARQLLLDVADMMSAAADGVVLDPQTGLARVGGVGGKIIEPAPIELDEDGLTLLRLSWWFTDSPLFEREGLLALVDLLAATLPEAMPRRYGLYEPPQHLFEETGRQHFLEFLHENALQSLVWYPHKPVAGVSLGLFANWGATPRLGFRANYLSISVDASSLEDPAWRTKIRVFWRAAPSAIRSFYGDMRSLGGYRWGRGTYYVTPESVHHPVTGPWWRGIPPGPRHSVMVGPPYMALWPEFAKGAHIEGEYAFLETRHWRPESDVGPSACGV